MKNSIKILMLVVAIVALAQILTKSRQIFSVSNETEPKAVYIIGSFGPGP